ncbi:MAG: aminomethyl-transferring glycine dehydrogenase [Ignavibacteriae bacterium]|nr:aminomethyl-transferring glycine dehydrogenase [Ignavibacteriota bacterium]
MNSNQDYTQFVNRHIPHRENDIKEILSTIGVNSIDELIEKTVPKSIRLENLPKLDEPLTEYELLNEMQLLGSKNKLYKNYIGMGYSTTVVPSVIKRNILENPSWYTQYTPYQAEISQGRLEALLNFQTMISDLTAMPIANASLLDEGTSAAEAMSMLFASRKGEKKNADTILISDKLFPQTIDVIKTRAIPLGIKIIVESEDEFELNENIFAIIVQYPAEDGSVINYTSLFHEATERGIFKIVAADLLSLTLLKPPGEFGADVVVGSTQRFGVPIGFGGPHAAYFATKDEYKRSIPGRIIGVSIDRKGNRALRMALQTREQHIKRERATSNICTAQVLLAIMAGMFAVYHGKEGLKRIAERINDLAKYLYSNLNLMGIEFKSNTFFDTLTFKLDSEDYEKLKNITLQNKINLRWMENNYVGISIGEDIKLNEVNELLKIISETLHKNYDPKAIVHNSIPQELVRVSAYLTHEVFHNYHSETEMMRYIKSLEKKDLSLTTSMIPLGSCTMKLNAASELYALSNPQFSNLHPFAPLDQAEGYLEMIKKLKYQIGELTGLPGVSLQPNSGAQGEYTGLLVIRAYHLDHGDEKRNVILIPSSAHGTNPASAVLAGNKVVIVKCDKNGNVDLEDLQNKAVQFKNELSGLMITYPSTHGVFEENIKEITKVIHDNGGLVYMDGANLNAQLCLTNPGVIGADVCHLNLHKTFAIPHGGGGPGVGPIAVTKELEKYLPGHSVVDISRGKSISAVSSAPYGSASVLTISYAYIRMMGSEGLKRATEISILNANYIKAKLANHYKTLYKGRNGFVAHELILDTRELKQRANIEVEDIAKRLMDYGYHAPTVSFPVAGTLMIEPTESESKKEIDKFCDAMEMIYNEIVEIEKGEFDKVDNVLKNAPHTFVDIISEWNHQYSIAKAVSPTKWVSENKFWPSVSRVDNAYGDRNLICSCLPIEEYQN